MYYVVASHTTCFVYVGLSRSFIEKHGCNRSDWTWTTVSVHVQGKRGKALGLQSDFSICTNDIHWIMTSSHLYLLFGREKCVFLQIWQQLICSVGKWLRNDLGMIKGYDTLHYILFIHYTGKCWIFRDVVLSFAGETIIEPTVRNTPVRWHDGWEITKKTLLGIT